MIKYWKILEENFEKIISDLVNWTVGSKEAKHRLLWLTADLILKSYKEWFNSATKCLILANDNLQNSQDGYLQI